MRQELTLVCLLMVLVALALYGQETASDWTVLPPTNSVPTALSIEDQLAVSRMQVDGLKVVLRLKDEEIRMLRARVEYFESRDRLKGLDGEVLKHKDAIDLKEQALKRQYQVPTGYALTEDVQWKKGPPQGVTK